MAQRHGAPRAPPSPFQHPVPGLVALSPACVRRTKRTMGLGSLYGENDLLDLDGDPQKERQVAEKQLAQLGDIL